MDDLFLVLFLVSLFGHLLCIISPRLVGWLIPGKPTRIKGIAILMAISFWMFVGFGLSHDGVEPVQQSSPKSPAPLSVEVKEVLDSVTASEDVSTTQDVEVLGLPRSPDQYGLSISRDSLIRAIHSWSSDFQFARLEGEEGVVGMRDQTIISILGPRGM